MSGSSIQTRRRHRAWNFVVAAAGVACAQLLMARTVHAQVADIYPTATSITSTADRMISYRNQQHSWQTSDGAMHVMVNQGSLPTGNSLALFSSFDGGATWNQMFALANTDAFSTSDGMLTTVAGGTNLLLVYATAQTAGTILYVSAAYNSAAQSWTLGAAQTAFATANFAGSNPAFAADSLGNYWCGFTAENLTTKQYEEMLLYRPAKAMQWSNTGLVFGGPDSSLQHSARPVPYNNGIAMIYESGQTMYWAYRLNNGAPITAPWTTSVLYTGLPPYSEDPYDTHYSEVSDAANDIHLTLIANQQLIYMRYLSSTNSWGPPRPLTQNTIQAAYSQATIADGNVLLLVNNEQSIEVFQSTNNGNSFTLTQALLHQTPPPGSALYYGNPRVETPSHSTSPVPTWQQFVNGPIQGLMFFSVPVLN
jgi:hypothetical protein